MEWQPIDTAPKDGTKILGFQPIRKLSNELSGLTANLRFVGEVGWEELDLYSDLRGWPSGWYTSEDHLMCNLTHWMPLPEPPKGDNM